MKPLPRPKPRLKLFSDPSAEAVWAAICVLDEGSQHDLLAELRRRLARADLRDGPADTRRADSIRALREAATFNGGSPSRRNYVQLRADHPEANWPSPTSLVRWLGARHWNEALAEAHLEAVADGEVLVLENGGAFTVGEVGVAVKEAAGELGETPTLTSYLAWARRPSTRRRPGRRPSSQGVFERLFPGQGFKGALAAAGLIDGDAGTGLVAGPRGRGYRYSDTEIWQALIEVATRLGSLPYGPRVAEYTRTRNLILAEEAAAGKPLRGFPTYQVIHARYPDSWDQALIAAVLRPLGGTSTAERSPIPAGVRRRLSDAQIRSDLLEGYRAIGEPFAYHAYSAWRAQMLERELARGEIRRIASAQTARSRYGSWKKVQEAVRAATEAAAA